MTRTGSNHPHDERRALILAAAERLLRHYGPQKTTIAEIAREAEVGVGTVYLEFPSKEAIVEELSAGRHQAVLDAMRHALAGGGTFVERFRRMFDARLAAFQTIEREGAHARDLVHCVNPAVKTAHGRYKAAEHELLAVLLTEAVVAGEFDCPDVADCAAALLQAYAAFGPPMVFGQCAGMTERLEALHRVVLYGLVRR